MKEDQKSVTVVFAAKNGKRFIGLVPKDGDREDLRVADKLIGGEPIESIELTHMIPMMVDETSWNQLVTERLASMRPQGLLGKPIQIGDETFRVYGLQVPFETLVEHKSYEAQCWPHLMMTGTFGRWKFDSKHPIALQESNLIFHTVSETLRHTSDALTLAAVLQLLQSERSIGWNSSFNND